METSLKNYFLDALDLCRQCADFCEQTKVYADNLCTTQALDILGEIRNPLARSAEEACRGCDHRSSRILGVLESAMKSFS
jgi:hypothetical protein